MNKYSESRGPGHDSGWYWTERGFKSGHDIPAMVSSFKLTCVILIFWASPFELTALIIGAISIIIINSLLVFFCYLMFRSGYKLKT